MAAQEEIAAHGERSRAIVVTGVERRRVCAAGDMLMTSFVHDQAKPDSRIVASSSRVFFARSALPQSAASASVRLSAT